MQASFKWQQFYQVYYYFKRIKHKALLQHDLNLNEDRQLEKRKTLENHAERILRT